MIEQRCGDDSLSQIAAAMRKMPCQSDWTNGQASVKHNSSHPHSGTTKMTKRYPLPRSSSNLTARLFHILQLNHSVSVASAEIQFQKVTISTVPCALLVSRSQFDQVNLRLAQATRGSFIDCGRRTASSTSQGSFEPCLTKYQKLIRQQQICQLLLDLSQPGMSSFLCVP